MEQHPKQKFQVERIAFFSDAVFAIAITLVIIEVKPPHFHHGMSSTEISKAFTELLPLFTGVIMSFVFIGVYWFSHHQLFKYIINYDRRLLILNLALLCSVVFLPFSTAFFSINGLSITGLPMIFYNANYIVTTLLTYFLFKHALDPAKGLSTRTDEDMNAALRGLLFPVFVFSIVILIACFKPLFSPFGYAVFGLERFFVKKKKAKDETTAVPQDNKEAEAEPVLAVEQNPDL